MTGPIDLKMLGSGVNWMPLMGQLAIWLAGYYSVLPEGSTCSVTAGEPGRTCFDGLLDVAEGKYHVAVTTPTSVGALGYRGLSPFDRKLPLRAIASFPHDDRMLFAVKKSTGLTSFADIRERRYPLRVSTPLRETRHPAAWIAQRVLQLHGLDFETIESWGGEVLRDRPRMLSGPAEETAPFDAVFDEAIMTLRWKRLTEDHDIHFLPIEEGAMRQLEEEGWLRKVLPKGRLRGVEQDLDCVDFSGWLAFCHEDLPEQIAYWIVMAIDAQRGSIERIANRPGSGLTGPIDMSQLGRDLPLPLHPGAERYYREHGYL